MRLLDGVHFEYCCGAEDCVSRCPLCRQPMSWTDGAEHYRCAGENLTTMECEDCGLIADTRAGACYLVDEIPEIPAIWNFQFYCADHDFGWSVDGDGNDSGCPQCLTTEERADLKADMAMDADGAVV